MSSADPAAAPSPPRRSFAARLWAALLLEDEVFREVAHDPQALGQATAVVVLGGVARGIAMLPDEGGVGLVLGVGTGVVLWLVSALVVRGAGRMVLGRTPALDVLVRTLGFAAAPLVALALVAVLPSWAGTATYWLAHAAAVLAATIAVRDACETTAARALLVCVLALAAGFAVVLIALLLLFGGEATAALSALPALGIASA